MELEYHIGAFKELATEKLPNGTWQQIYEFLGGMPAHLIGRLCLRLFARLVELEQRFAKLEGQLNSNKQ